MWRGKNAGNRNVNQIYRVNVHIYMINGTCSIFDIEYGFACWEEGIELISFQKRHISPNGEWSSLNFHRKMEYTEFIIVKRFERKWFAMKIDESLHCNRSFVSNLIKISINTHRTRTPLLNSYTILNSSLI